MTVGVNEAPASGRDITARIVSFRRMDATWRHTKPLLSSRILLIPSGSIVRQEFREAVGKSSGMMHFGSRLHAKAIYSSLSSCHCPLIKGNDQAEPPFFFFSVFHSDNMMLKSVVNVGATEAESLDANWQE